MDSKIFREAALAYQAVYDEELRQEIEEQQDFENWVNSLVEEGYDLSEYTWEDMYEAYLSEGGAGPRASVPASATGKYKSSSDGKYYKNYNDALAARNSRLNTLRSAQDMLRGKPSRLGATPAERARPAAPTPAARPAATTPASGGSSTPAARPAASAPAARPASTAAARPAASAPTAKPAPTAAAKSSAAPAPTAAAKPKTPNPLMQKTFGYQTGKAPDQVAKTAAPTPAAKPTPTPAKRPMGSVKPGSLVSGFDMFDVVKGYLIDEGFAETEQAAIAIMANMSEDWKLQIIDEASRAEEYVDEAQHARENPEKYEREQEKRTSKRQKAMNDPHKGINSPAFAEFMRKQMGR